MKYIYRINIFAVTLPFAIATLGVFNQDFLIFALLSTMVTGGLQVLLAIISFYKNPKEVHLYIYSTLTILFFLLWKLYPNNEAIFFLPPALAIYHFNIIRTLYKREKKNEP
ncbi:hypothetical protein V1389_00255 [Flavobacterium rakeshii]|uniref:hypothetical protein n=1 Tax=Flavobacterium TaxID=237 RepID=UPI002E7B969D|nr:hypothetical protein [Flavobacterium rakeshii]MEE1896744.1 hypothetical protein [Flavobacterium rakeshii]